MARIASLLPPTSLPVLVHKVQQSWWLHSQKCPIHNLQMWEKFVWIVVMKIHSLLYKKTMYLAALSDNYWSVIGWKKDMFTLLLSVCVSNKPLHRYAKMYRNMEEMKLFLSIRQKNVSYQRKIIKYWETSIPLFPSIASSLPEKIAESSWSKNNNNNRWK